MKIHVLTLGLAFFLARVSSADELLPPGTGDLRSLTSLPNRVALQGENGVQQLAITGQFANQGLRDVTHQAKYVSSDPAIARVDGDGLIVAVGDGTTEIIAQSEGKSTKIRVTVEGAGKDQPINFTNEIVPIFSKLGCNSGACHGKSTGQNGFRLSLLGFEPVIDYDALIHETRGRRVLPSAPEASLLLRKPTGELPHGGGSRLKRESRDYQTLLRWLRAGTPFGQESDPKVVRLSIQPSQRLIAPQSSQQIIISAHYDDGSERDVTHDVEYSSNHPEIANVTESGLVQTLDVPGEGAIMIRYLGHVGVFRAIVPQAGSVAKDAFPTPANYIDEHVFAKLKQLGLSPSADCSDSEFLRRVSIDIIGTLPTAKEAETFLADRDPRRREKLVDALLARPEYASHFALKWGDILRNRRDNLVGVGGKGERTAALHTWLKESFTKNKPYDQIVREILTAKGDFAGDQGQPPVGWYVVLRTPQALVDDMAQVFLGTRIQCAQCHHHPYEKWSQDDYWGLAAFFARVQLTNPKSPMPVKANAKPGQNDVRVTLLDSAKVTGPHGKSYDKPRALERDELDVPASADPREKLVEWMVRPDNPFFAKALVNRYWAHFFGRGIVDMPDDMRVSNPPSNEPLLTALAKDFLDHRFDIKHVIRMICTSRTYQFSSTPNERNAKDKQNYARFYARRLSAEVLFDAIDQVTGAPLKFTSPRNAKGGGITAKSAALRAIDLPDESIKTQLLVAFGKPERGTACECERSNSATLTQSLYLLSSPEFNNKLKEKSGRITTIAADSRPIAEKLREIYLWVYARPPESDEMKTVVDYLSANNHRKEAYEDVFWALLNTKEFLFNH